jgi:hypothetical protein
MTDHDVDEAEQPTIPQGGAAEALIQWPELRGEMRPDLKAALENIWEEGEAAFRYLADR